MSADLFGVTLPEMIRELERHLDDLRDTWPSRRVEILHAIIARLKRGAADAA